MHSPKKIGLVIAAGLPPPGKLKRAMMAKDEGESSQDAQDESDSGDSGGGVDAISTMRDAMKGGDMTAAWDAFCDAVDIAKNRSSKPEGDSGSSDSGY